MELGTRFHGSASAATGTAWQFTGSGYRALFAQVRALLEASLSSSTTQRRTGFPPSAQVRDRCSDSHRVLPSPPLLPHHRKSATTYRCGHDQARVCLHQPPTRLSHVMNSGKPARQAAVDDASGATSGTPPAAHGEKLETSPHRTVHAPRQQSHVGPTGRGQRSEASDGFLPCEAGDEVPGTHARRGAMSAPNDLKAQSTRPCFRTR